MENRHSENAICRKNMEAAGIEPASLPSPKSLLCRENATGSSADRALRDGERSEVRLLPGGLFEFISSDADLIRWLEDADLTLGRSLRQEIAIRLRTLTQEVKS